MVPFVGFQAGLGLILSLAVLGVAGFNAALSCLIGSAGVWLPNLFFAARLISARNQIAVVWLLGQMIKLGLSLLWLLVVGKYWPSVSWPALLVGLTVTGLTVFVGPWFLGRAERREHRDRVDALLNANKPKP